MNWGTSFSKSLRLSKGSKLSRLLVCAATGSQFVMTTATTTMKLATTTTISSRSSTNEQSSRIVSLCCRCVTKINSLMGKYARFLVPEIAAANVAVQLQIKSWERERERKRGRFGSFEGCRMREEGATALREWYSKRVNFEWAPFRWLAWFVAFARDHSRCV